MRPITVVSLDPNTLARLKEQGYALLSAVSCSPPSHSPFNGSTELYYSKTTIRIDLVPLKWGGKDLFMLTTNDVEAAKKLPSVLLDAQLSLSHKELDQQQRIRRPL
jgi:hypothetical protein